MLILIAFLSGATAFFSSRYFPLTTGFFLFILAGSIYCSLHTTLSSRLRNVTLFFIACIAGFYIAATGQGSTGNLERLEGKTITGRGTPITDSVLLDADRELRGQTFRMGSARDLSGTTHTIRQVRVLSNCIFALDRSYDLTLRMPRQMVFHNPGMQQSLLPTGYLVISEEREGPLLAPFARARTVLHRFFLDHFSSKAGSFLISIVTGERGYIPRELNQAFGTTGLSHILSISGTHFGLVFFALFQLCRFLILRLPESALCRLTLRLSPSQAGAALALPALILYLCISDMSYPAIRSFLMIMLFLAGLLLGRKGVWLNTLCVAAAMIVAFDPEAITDLSFQLSFLASLSIGLVSDWLKSRQNRDLDTPLSKMSQQHTARRFLAGTINIVTASLAISLAASLGTAPLVALHFHYLSLISPLTNLVLTPIIGLLVLPFTLAGSFMYLMTGYFPACGILEQLTSTILTAVQTCASIPHADLRMNASPPIYLIVFYGLLCGLVWFRICIPMLRGEKNIFLSGIHAILLIITIALALAWCSMQHREGMLVTFLDVGQGDAAVLETPDNHIMVIDTGRNHLPVNAYLRYRGIRTVDALVLSHGHPDHTSGFTALMRDYRIRELWDNGRLHYASPVPADLIHRKLERGDTLEANGYRFTALHPYREYRAEQPATEENNDSLVLKLDTSGSSILFTGDIAVDAEESLLPLGKTLVSTVLKIPHHGSRTSLSESFLRSIHPRYALISVGRNNRYSHPHPATLQTLSGTDIYRTDRDGAVSFLLKPDGTIAIKTWQQARLHPVSSILDERKNAERLLTVW